MTYQKICQKCKRPLKSNRRNFCDACNVASQRLRNKERLVEYKGGKCKVCGYNRCITNLVFHHLDPHEKEFGLASKLKSLESLKKEADKCVLLCANCHGEIHSGLITI
jgi:hypothetical protein